MAINLKAGKCVNYPDIHRNGVRRYIRIVATYCRGLAKEQHKTGANRYSTSLQVTARSDLSDHLAVSPADLDSVTILHQPITEYRLVEFTFTFGLEASSISAESET